MSPWEFAVCVDGHNRAHGDHKPAPPTDEEFDEAIRQYERTYGTLH